MIGIKNNSTGGVIILKFGVFLTLFYLLDSLVFKEFYDGIFHLSLLAVAQVLDLEVVEKTEGLALYTQMIFAPYGGKVGFIIDDSILSQMHLILFKLPILLALVFTFSNRFKTIALSIVAIVILQISIGFISVLDMALTAGGSNKIIASYLTMQGVMELAQIVGTFKLFLSGYLQKFFAFGLGFYLFEKSGVKLTDLSFSFHYLQPKTVKEVAQ